MAWVYFAAGLPEGQVRRERYECMDRKVKVGFNDRNGMRMYGPHEGWSAVRLRRLYIMVRAMSCWRGWRSAVGPSGVSAPPRQQGTGADGVSSGWRRTRGQ